MTTREPGAFLGKRVRLSGYVRTEDAAKAVMLWLRVDGPNRQLLAIDNMSTRPIKGTTGWNNHDVVLDVPAQAELERLKK